MKLLKLAALSILFTIAGCTSDQHNTDVVEDTKLQKTSDLYTFDDILSGMRTWETMRTSNKNAILPFLANVNSFSLDVSKFPQGIGLNAYACILNGQLKFAVISEMYDNIEYSNNLIDYVHIIDLSNTDISIIKEKTYGSYTFPSPTQYIQATDALNRIEDWNLNYASWLTNTLTVYQGFNIPTYGLQQQNYKVYLGLKSSESNSTVKLADLILDNNNGMFYDTIHMYPPKINNKKHYVLDLL